MENDKTKEIFDEIYNSMSDEQKQKALKCETTDEFLVLAGEEGIPLPDEMLEQTVGGVCMYVEDMPVKTGISGVDFSGMFKEKHATFGKTAYNSKPFGK